MSQQTRPTITNGKTGVGNFGVGIMPDGTTDSLRILITPDGFHFKPTDFDDLVLPSLSFESTKGTKYDLSFDDNGTLLINNNVYAPTSNEVAIAKETAQKALDALDTKVSQSDYNEKNSQLNDKFAAQQQTIDSLVADIQALKASMDNAVFIKH